MRMLFGVDSGCATNVYIGSKDVREMFWFMMISVLTGLFVLIHRLWPAPYLTQIHYRNLINQKESLHHFKIVDIRDAYEYENQPTPDSINISLGRLPYVWHKHLLREERIFILSNEMYRAKKAARILRKKGFQSLYVVEMDRKPVVSTPK